jgi:hypothetical protein
MYQAPPGHGQDAGSAKLYVAGNVGIGTTAPSQKLEVVGNADISNHLAVGANASINTYRTLEINENYSGVGNNDTYGIYNYQQRTDTITSDTKAYGIYNELRPSFTESDAYAYGYASYNKIALQNYDLQEGYGAFNVVESYSNTTQNTIAGAQNYALFSDKDGLVYNLIGAKNYARTAQDSDTDATAEISNAYGALNTFISYGLDITNAYGSYNSVSATTWAEEGDVISNAYGAYARVINSDNTSTYADIQDAYAFYGETYRVDSNALTFNNATGLYLSVADCDSCTGIEIASFDTDTVTGYGLKIGALDGSTNYWGIWGDEGDWILAADGDGASGGTSGGGDLILGEGQDLELYHDSNNSYIVILTLLTIPMI